MKNILEIFSDMRFIVFSMIIIVLIGGAVNVADAPLLEATTPATILCYQVDDAGRIIDNDGRLRGWMKGSEVYGPDLRIMYRIEGKYLRGVN